MNEIKIKRLLIFLFAALIVKDIQAKTSGYAATHAKISALRVKQAEIEGRLAICDAGRKSEPGCSDMVRNEMSTSLNMVIQEIAKVQIAGKMASRRERALVWHERQNRFIPGNLSIEAALKKNLGTIRLKDEIVFFDSDAAFRHWLKTANPADPVDIRLQYASSKSTYIKTCQDSSGALERKRRVAYLSIDPQCPQRGIKANYRIYRIGGQMQVELDRRLVYRGARKNYDLVKQRLDQVQTCVRNIYANQGISLHFHYRIDDSFSLSSSDEKIHIYDEYGRNDATNWGILATEGSRDTPEQVCTMIAHELGHHLGLYDRYPDSACPARPRENAPLDLMISSQRPAELLRINDQEIRQILEPLCNKEIDFFYADEPEYGAFFSIGLGVQKFTTSITDFGYQLSAGVTSVGDDGGFAELQLNYSQPGLALNSANVLQDRFRFGYTQAIVNFGSFLGKASFVRLSGKRGSINPSFFAFYFGLGIHVWNYSGDAQKLVSENNPFALSQTYPKNQATWVFDAGLSYFIIRQLQLRLQYSFISTEKPYYQTISLLLQYNVSWQ
ncbi:MAG: hypothetical protein JNJ69_01840 [Leptospiraceae bacterium]|nr:hypothetical protein [Leptospiraceae bacterium]